MHWVSILVFVVTQSFSSFALAEAQSNESASQFKTIEKRLSDERIIILEQVNSKVIESARALLAIKPTYIQNESNFVYFQKQLKEPKDRAFLLTYLVDLRKIRSPSVYAEAKKITDKSKTEEALALAYAYSEGYLSDFTYFTEAKKLTDSFTEALAFAIIVSQTPNLNLKGVFTLIEKVPPASRVLPFSLVLGLKNNIIQSIKNIPVELNHSTSVTVFNREKNMLEVALLRQDSGDVNIVPNYIRLVNGVNCTHEQAMAILLKKDFNLDFYEKNRTFGFDHSDSLKIIESFAKGEINDKESYYAFRKQATTHEQAIELLSLLKLGQITNANQYTALPNSSYEDLKDLAILKSSGKVTHTDDYFFMRTVLKLSSKQIHQVVEEKPGRSLQIFLAVASELSFSFDEALKITDEICKGERYYYYQKPADSKDSDEVVKLKQQTVDIGMAIRDRPLIRYLDYKLLVEAKMAPKDALFLSISLIENKISNVKDFLEIKQKYKLEETQAISLLVYFNQGYPKSKENYDAALSIGFKHEGAFSLAKDLDSKKIKNFEFFKELTEQMRAIHTIDDMFLVSYANALATKDIAIKDFIELYKKHPYAMQVIDLLSKENLKKMNNNFDEYFRFRKALLSHEEALLIATSYQGQITNLELYKATGMIPTLTTESRCELTVLMQKEPTMRPDDSRLSFLNSKLSEGIFTVLLEVAQNNIKYFEVYRRSKENGLSHEEALRLARLFSVSKDPNELEKIEDVSKELILSNKKLTWKNRYENLSILGLQEKKALDLFYSNYPDKKNDLENIYKEAKESLDLIYPKIIEVLFAAAEFNIKNLSTYKSAVRDHNDTHDAALAITIALATGQVKEWDHYAVLRNTQRSSEEALEAAILIDTGAILGWDYYYIPAKEGRTHQEAKEIALARSKGLVKHWDDYAIAKNGKAYTHSESIELALAIGNGSIAYPSVYFNFRNQNKSHAEAIEAAKKATKESQKPK